MARKSKKLHYLYFLRQVRTLWLAQLALPIEWFGCENRGVRLRRMAALFHPQNHLNTIHRDLPAMIRAAMDRDIGQVMANTNGIRLARGDRFLDLMARLNPVFYFRLDGLSRETCRTIQGEDPLDTKVLALDGMARTGQDAMSDAGLSQIYRENASECVAELLARIKASLTEVTVFSGLMDGFRQDSILGELSPITDWKRLVDKLEKMLSHGPLGYRVYAEKKPR